MNYYDVDDDIDNNNDDDDRLGKMVTKKDDDGKGVKEVFWDTDPEDGATWPATSGLLDALGTGGRALMPVLGILMLGVVFAAYEYPGFARALHECEGEYALHRAFAERPICTADVQRADFERADLLDCTRAERYVVSEYPLLCTLPRWMQTSLPGALLLHAYERTQAVGAGATSWPMVLLGSFALLAAFWIVWGQRGETQRHAISVGAQQEQAQVMASLVRKVQRTDDEPLALRYQDVYPAEAAARRRKGRSPISDYESDEPTSYDED